MTDLSLVCCPSGTGCRGHVDCSGKHPWKCSTCGYVIEPGALGQEAEAHAGNEGRAEYVTFRLPCGHGDTLLRGWWGEASLDSLWEDRRCSIGTGRFERQPAKIESVADPVTGIVRREVTAWDTFEIATYRSVSIRECLNHVIGRERYNGPPLPLRPDLQAKAEQDGATAWRERMRAGL